jgi:microcystin-dependent protein
MSQPFVGEIRCFGFQFTPQGWAFCNGQLLQISEFAALFTILGTTYGGDGQTTFAVPNLQGAVPMHWGNPAGGFNTVIGQVQGVTLVTLTQVQMPQHAHTIVTAVVAPGGAPERTATPSSTTFIGTSNPDGLYKMQPSTLDSAFSANAIGSTGSSLPHDNMQPYLALNFCISLFGIFPSRN